jgi:hypothetical protein
MPIPFRVKLLVLLPALTAGTAVAADTLLLPPENVRGNVRYMTGGVGFDEAEAMRQAASHYPLTIELAAKPNPRDAYPRDVYLSSVRVDIRDEQGQSLITTTTDGPILLASLPPGRYTINAEIRGVSQQKTVTVGSGAPQRVLFEFPVD